MPMKTTPRGYPAADAADNDMTFLTFRTNTFGTQVGSAIMQIDSDITKLENSVQELQSTPSTVFLVATAENDTSYYATEASVEGYVRNTVFIISFGRDNKGITSININSLGAKYVKKTNLNGELVDPSAGELLKNRNYLMRYDGTYFVVLSSFSPEVSATSGNLLSAAADGTISDSGVSISSVQNKSDKPVSPVDGNLPQLDADGNLVDSGKSVSSFVPVERKVNGHALSEDVTLTFDDTGSVPTGRTINLKPLSSDITLEPVDVGAVPTGRKVNGKTLEQDITLVPDDVGAVPSTRTVNGKSLSADIDLAPSDVGAVPDTRTVNGKPLSSDINLTNSDVGAAATSHGTHVTYSTTNPVVDGTASPGSAGTVARSDHKHPTDTTRAPLASPTFTGTPKTTANTSYGTAQLRNIYAGTGAMTAGTTALSNGVIYCQYE